MCIIIMCINVYVNINNIINDNNENNIINE